MRGRGILVVDDEPSVRSIVARILRRSGYGVSEAATPLDAQDQIRSRETPFDLVISDVMMPHMRGPDLAQWIVARHPATSILLISGFADAELVQGWISADPDAFLAKPFEPEELVNRVEQRLAAVTP